MSQNEALGQTLMMRALVAREKAYAPYSKFSVGAALQTTSGEIFEGCNIENCSYGLTNCAERTAIFKAVSEGHTKVNGLAVVGNTDDPIAPCGACRQVIAEFAERDTPVWLTNLKGDIQQTTVGDLLPGAFGAGDLT